MDWISVKDRLPEEGQRVLFYVDKADKNYAKTIQAGRFKTFEYQDGYKSPEFSFPGYTTFATHWMPLPDPPEQP